MTDAEKRAMLKSLLNVSDTSLDAQLGVYLSFAKKEIISWRYGTANNTSLLRAVFDDDYGKASVSAPVFISAISINAALSNGKYVFTYSGENESWMYASAEIALSDYGITYSGLSPRDGDTITVTYNDHCLDEFDMVQIMACVAGYSISGAENETSHSENGIQRSFRYSDIVDYIRAHVPAIAGVI